MSDSQNFFEDETQDYSYDVRDLQEEFIDFSSTKERNWENWREREQEQDYSNLREQGMRWETTFETEEAQKGRQDTWGRERWAKEQQALEGLFNNLKELASSRLREQTPKKTTHRERYSITNADPTQQETEYEYE